MSFGNLTRRYGNIPDEALVSILTPKLIPIISLDKTVVKLHGQNHFRAKFSVKITAENYELMQRGTTGKFISASFLNGAPWKEICKGRIVDVDFENSIACGEIYIGSKNTKQGLTQALKSLAKGDYLEIDQYGASAKIVSSLSEYFLAGHAKNKGFKVRRMPEDTAKHLGTYYNYDFEFEKNGVIKKVEAKSLWGTDIRYARLIHSRGPNYPTSSCKFETQDIFAVSLFLRTGNIQDFAFAKSISKDDSKTGLITARHFPAHVNQNPLCTVGDGSWFSDIEEVW